MGLGLFNNSSSSYDTPQVKTVVVKVEQERVKFPNPNPKNCQITFTYTLGRYLVIKVHYPDCTNYEGNKVLVYKDVTLTQLKQQGSIDPHFSDNPKFHSPIARFVPNDEGLGLAIKMIVELDTQGR